MAENTQLTLQEIRQHAADIHKRDNHPFDSDPLDVIAKFEELLGQNGYRIQKVVQVETATERAQAG